MEANFQPRACSNMAKAEPKSVAGYIAARPAPVRRALASVRGAIRKALPSADEIISYKIPAYRLDGRVLIYFAGWSKHYAIYPVRAHVVASFSGKMPLHEFHGSTLRLPLSEPVPARFIAHVARAMAGEAKKRNNDSSSPKKRAAHKSKSKR